MNDEPDKSNDMKIYSDDSHRAVEACEHALHSGDLVHAQVLLRFDEARIAVKRAQHDESGQVRCETADD